MFIYGMMLSFRYYYYYYYYSCELLNTIFNTVNLHIYVTFFVMKLTE
jgi:hypothetical protein